MVEFFRKNINLLVFLGFSAWGLYWRFIILKGRELWGDENYQYHCMEGLFRPFWLRQTYGDFSSFPGEYLLNYLVVHWFGPNKWGLAIPHILVTVLGFWLLYKLGRYYFHSWVGYAVAFSILALNREVVYHSFEFRPYAVLPVLALGSLLLAHRLVEDGRNWGIAKTCLTGLLIVLIINYHIYGVAIFLLPLLYVMLSNFLRKDKVWVMPWPLMLALFFALCLWGYYVSLTNSGMISTCGFGPFHYIPNPLEKPGKFLSSILSALIGIKKGHIFLLSVIVSIFILGGKKLEQFIFVNLLVILPILLVLYGDLKSQYWFLSRQFFWVSPFFGIFLGWQWDAIHGFIKSKFQNRNKHIQNSE